MSQKNFMYVIGAVVVILIAVFIYKGWFSGGEDVNLSKNSSITNFSVEKPNFVVTAKNASKIEIWGVPSDISDPDHLLLGTANLTTPAGDNEIWKLGIPREPISLKEIYALAFDSLDKESDKASLNFKGETDIFYGVWGPVSEKEQSVKLNESMTFEGLTLTPRSVSSDSRCPKDVQCIQAGNVVVKVEAVSEEGSETFEITSVGNPVLFGRYYIELKNVMPEKVSDKAIAATEYALTFILSLDAKL
jgi:hypothetical protein